MRGVPVAVLAVLAGCAASGPGEPDASACAAVRADGGWPIPVDFVVDDTANRVFGPGDLQWVGSMRYEPTTRRIDLDPTWGGPFPLLHDDGPWSCGGHEPLGEVAGDHRWGITAFASPPGPETYTYGLRDLSAAPAFGWAWPGPNGSFRVEPGGPSPVAAAGLVLPPFGDVDLTVVVDTAALAAGPWDATRVEVAADAWYWMRAAARDDGLGGDEVAGDHRFTLALSSVVGPGHAQPHLGLLRSGDLARLVVVLGGQEYRDTPDGGAVLTQGLSAFARLDGGPPLALPLTPAPRPRPASVAIP